jgi:hypothetical protein
MGNSFNHNGRNEHNGKSLLLFLVVFAVPLQGGFALPVVVNGFRRCQP